MLRFPSFAKVMSKILTSNSLLCSIISCQIKWLSTLVTLIVPIWLYFTLANCTNCYSLYWITLCLCLFEQQCCNDVSHLCIHQRSIGQALVDEDMHQCRGTKGRYTTVIDPDHQAVQTPVSSLQGFCQGYDPTTQANLKQTKRVSAYQSIADISIRSCVAIGGWDCADYSPSPASGWQEGIWFISRWCDGWRVVIFISDKQGDGGSGRPWRFSTINSTHAEWVCAASFAVKRCRGENGSSIIFNRENFLLPLFARPLHLPLHHAQQKDSTLHFHLHLHQ